MKDSLWPALSVAAALVLIGSGMISSHVRSWRREQADPSMSDDDRTYYRRRYRRRMQTSAILVVLGVLIGLGDALLSVRQLNQAPLLTTLYWIGVLVLTGWVMLLGFGDLWSTAARTQVELSRAREKQRELERQIVEFKHQHFGRRSPDGDAAADDDARDDDAGDD